MRSDAGSDLRSLKRHHRDAAICRSDSAIARPKIMSFVIQLVKFDDDCERSQNMNYAQPESRSITHRDIQSSDNIDMR